MKTKLLLAVSLVLTMNAFAQAPNWDWAKNSGGSSGSTANNSSNCLAIDGNGNSYITGSFATPTITFGSTTLTKSGTNGFPDMFIVKYDASGAVVWAKSAGGSSGNSGTSGNSIAVDGNGNSYVTGSFSSPTITFGSTTLTCAGSGSLGAAIFTVKYDASGTVVWAKSAGGDKSDFGNSIAVDGNGNSYVTGSFRSPTITFGSTTLTGAGSGSYFDMFIVKYDASGTALWAKSAGGDNFDDIGNRIAVDGNGNSYVTGSFKSPTITFGSTTLTLTSGGSAMFFVVKYDASGTAVLAWTQSAGGSIAVDGNGNMYIFGSFGSPTITFGGITLTVTGNGSLFIVKYDASGTALWAKSAGGYLQQNGNSIAVDGNGSSYITGGFGSPTITFGSITLTNFNNPNNGNQFDVFIVKYDTSGTVAWAKSAGGSYNDSGNSIAVDGNGNSYVTGEFQSPTINFGSTTLTLVSAYTVFVAKVGTTTTGIEELQDGGSLSIAPNPASNIISITGINEKTILRIYNVVGKLVVEKEVDYNTTINTSQLAEGIYTLLTESKKGRIMNKVVISR